MSSDVVEEKELIFYFENMIDRLKKNVISDNEKADLSLLYIKQLYIKQLDENDNEKNLEYLSLGWYIHKFLLKSNALILLIKLNLIFFTLKSLSI